MREEKEYFLMKITRDNDNVMMDDKWYKIIQQFISPRMIVLWFIKASLSISLVCVENYQWDCKS